MGHQPHVYTRPIDVTVQGRYWLGHGHFLTVRKIFILLEAAFSIHRSLNQMVEIARIGSIDGYLNTKFLALRKRCYRNIPKSKAKYC